MDRKETEFCQDKSVMRRLSSAHIIKNAGHGKLKTSYLETLIHHFKGNVGPGCYAMGDAFRNGGLLVSPILTAFLAIIYVHSQHLLLKCSKQMQLLFELDDRPSYPETVELCFKSGPENLQKYSIFFKRACNTFICTIQLGICCVFILFIATNIQQVCDFFDYQFELDTLILLTMIPILFTSLILDLKYLVPFSAVADVCMMVGISITFYYSFQNLPSIEERDYLPKNLPLYFGTVVYAFEGISLVLPLQNSMRSPKNFSKFLGVLNVGMFLETSIFFCFGFVGYLKYGENVHASLSLNLPNNEWLAQIVKLATSVGTLLGYPLQFFVAIQILFPLVRSRMILIDSNPVFGELLFRTLVVAFTYLVAKFIPRLNLLLSLLGAVCSTALSLVFPPMIHLIMEDRISWFTRVKNFSILGLAIMGFSAGTFESVRAIIKSFQ